MSYYRITLFGVKETTKIIADYLHHQGIHVDLIISIDPTIVNQFLIADYTDLTSTASAIDSEYYAAKDYTLGPLDAPFFAAHAFELGIVYGWQRIIPTKILEQFSKGIFGFHASPERLPHGRGRSPLNWGIILGKKTLYNHLFHYVSEADAGAVYSITEFSITPHDTILTVVYKSLLIAKKELVRLIHDAKIGVLTLSTQTGPSSHFLKRTPTDGLIDFSSQTTQDIVNLIRGVTRPFPGAFCFSARGKQVTIWEAWAFDSVLDFSAYHIGEIIDNLYDMPIVKTNDGSIILKEYEGETLVPHDLLSSS